MLNIQLIKIRQRFNRERLPDVKAALTEELHRLSNVLTPNAKIAIAVGSRGIANIDLVVKTAVNFVKDHGAEPFIVPAMGSHGGASAAGQIEVLAGYGITEDTVGAPIRSSMEVVELPKGDCVNRIFMDRHAYESEGVIVINRIKLHTDFHGTYESGLVKMCVIGLGKHRQALEIHRYGVYGLKELIPPTAKQIIATGKIIAGIALVENAYDETMVLRALKADEIMSEEPGLLSIANANMPGLPIDEIDVLICDRIGKNISGVGLDPKIIGRIRIREQAEPKSPTIKSIVISDLTEESHGNALGMGLADVMTRRLYEKIDFASTYENTYTSTFLERSKIPIVAENDEKAVDIALRSCGPILEGMEMIVRIQDTLHLDELYVSQGVLERILHRDDIEVIGEPINLFDDKGALTAF